MVLTTSLLISAAVFVATFVFLDRAPLDDAQMAGRRAKARLLIALGNVWSPGILRRIWATEEIGRKLRQSGLPLDERAFAAIRWITLVLTLSAAGLFLWAGEFTLFSGFLAALALAAAIFGPGIWLNFRVEQRRLEIDLSLADFLDRLSLALQAGLGFEIALRRSSASYPGRLGEELRRVNRQIGRGKWRAAALDEMVQRNPSDDLRAFVSTVKQSDRLGTSLAESLALQTKLLRSRRRRRAQEASRRLPILIVFPLVFFFLPALMLIYLAPPLLFLFFGR